jgi:hypothetical protein
MLQYVFLAHNNPFIDDFDKKRKFVMQKRWLKTTILYCGQENQKK